MFSDKQKDLVNHLMNEGKVQWYDKGGQWCDPIGSVPNLIYEIITGGDIWRKKPKTKTTYIWVDEGGDDSFTTKRSDDGPWDDLFDRDAFYKIEESRKEIEVAS